MERKLLDLCAALNFVLFERLAENSFNIIGTPPVWLKKLRVEADADAPTFKCDGKFYYLKDFLVEAEKFWRDAENHGRRLTSGSWVQIAAAGEEFYLEATAVFLAGEPVLLIESLGDKHLRLQAKLQIAREMILQREMLEGALVKLFNALDSGGGDKREINRDV
ncbi:MAG: hypothetical protein NVSMB56_04360 [Pyrinomonadaceae bacterium]